MAPKVIEDFGEEHIRTGKPSAYTSADSVLQIAAHEDHFGLERLYEVCRVARELTYPMNIGRVIARPFVGDAPATYRRTQYRKDFSLPPPAGSIFDRALINPDTNDIAPRVGPTGQLVAISRAEIVNQWSLWWGVAMMVTGSLVICGDPINTTNAQGVSQAWLRAYDKATGKEVGAVFLEKAQTGAAMTYMLGGKQYVVLAINGSNGNGGELIAFSLPN